MKSVAGFTLLEAVVAIALFTIAFAEILSLQGRSINDAFTARQYNTVAKLARNKMIEIELQLRGKGFREVPTEQNGNFDGQDQDYRWSSKITEMQFPDMTSLMNSTSSGEKDSGSGEAENSSGTFGQMISKGVTKYLNNSLRLITVSIFWKKGAKEQEFTVSTYWVDLGNDLSL